MSKLDRLNTLLLFSMLDQQGKLPTSPTESSEVSLIQRSGSAKHVYELEPLWTDTTVDPVNGTWYDMGTVTDVQLWYVNVFLSAAENSRVRLTIDGTAYEGAVANHNGNQFYYVDYDGDGLVAQNTLCNIMYNAPLECRSLQVEYGVTSNLNAGESMVCNVRYGSLV